MKKSKLKQKRTIEKRNKIMETAMEMIAEQGYFSVTTNHIAQKAGTSIGSLYSHFEDKKALMMACIVHYYDLVGGRTYPSEGELSVIDEKSGTAYLAATIEAVFLAHQILPGFHRAMMAACLQDPDMYGVVEKKEEEAKGEIWHLLERGNYLIHPTNLSMAADMIYLVVSETVHKYMNGEMKYTQKELADQLLRWIKAYLFL